MTDNLFDNAKFGDMFLTAENKQAVFLRFSENAEYEFAMLYVEGWGNVQVFRHNGKEIYNDAAHSIISKQKEPVNEDLPKDVQNACKLGAKWQKAKDQSNIELAEDQARKACDAYCKVCGHYAHTTPVHICRQACDYYKDFKKYVKGE